jgi:hypothetical protein
MGDGEPTQQNGLRKSAAGRYPANVVHDGSDEVLAAFAEFGEKKVLSAPTAAPRSSVPGKNGTMGDGDGTTVH